MTDEIPQLVRNLLYAQEHNLLDDLLGRAMQLAIDTNVANDFIIGQFEKRVHNHKIAQFRAGPFPVPEFKSGDFVQGFDFNGRPVTIPRQYLNAHCLTVAGSGSGKTTKAQFHALQIVLTVAGAWLFDCRKREYGKIRPLLANAYIGTQTNLAYNGPEDFSGYASAAEAGPGDDNVRLFDMSSPIPPCIRQNLIDDGIFPNLREGARLFFDVRTKDMLKQTIQVVGSLGSRADRTQE